MLAEHAGFIVIGGYAVRAHGYLRPTSDLDLLVDCSETNLVRIRQALEVVDAARIDEAVELLTESPNPVIHWSDSQLFGTTGTFKYGDVVGETVTVRVGLQSLPIISCAQLIRAKRYAAGRSARGDKANQDLEDATRLEEIGEGRAESNGSRKFRHLSGAIGIGGFVVALVAGLAGFAEVAGTALLVCLAVPWLAFIGHLNLTRSLGSEEKAVWRRQLWWSHRSMIALWAYLFAHDLRDRTKGFAPYRSQS